MLEPDRKKRYKLSDITRILNSPSLWSLILSILNLSILSKINIFQNNESNYKIYISFGVRLISIHLVHHLQPHLHNTSIGFTQQGFIHLQFLLHLMEVAYWTLERFISRMQLFYHWIFYTQFVVHVLILTTLRAYWLHRFRYTWTWVRVIWDWWWRCNLWCFG